MTVGREIRRYHEKQPLDDREDFIANISSSETRRKTEFSPGAALRLESLLSSWSISGLGEEIAVSKPPYRHASWCCTGAQ